MGSANATRLTSWLPAFSPIAAKPNANRHSNITPESFKKRIKIPPNEFPPVDQQTLTYFKGLDAVRGCNFSPMRVTKEWKVGYFGVNCANA
jgi:hypothetical protein